MDIRPCTAADLDLLTSRWPLRAGVHEAHYGRRLEDRSEYLVAWHDDNPLGSVVLRCGGLTGPQATAAYPEAVEICHLHVRPEQRGQGVGTRLIEAAEREALRRGHHLVAMGVGEDNSGALRLYKRLGYSATGIFDTSEYDWVGDNGTVHHARERDQLLVKPLRALE